MSSKLYFMNDYYRILEVEPNATQEQIKEQYKFLVQAWHPDRFGSPESKAKAEEKLKKINEAHDVLKPLLRGNNTITKDNILKENMIMRHRPNMTAEGMKKQK